MRTPLAAGTLLHNRYCIVQVLGQGGFAYTYLAQDQGRFDEFCVLKELAPIQSDQLVQARAMFRREAAILSQIRHPQIPRFRATLELDEGQETRLFLIEDYVAGQTYRQLLRERKSRGEVFSELEVRTLLIKILPVLAYLHHQGIIHGDISPENLILDQTKLQPVLIDFGIVQEMPGSHGRETVITQTRVGKLGFAPNEQLQRGRVSLNSDLHALAVTAIVLLTGQERSNLLAVPMSSWDWCRWARVTPEFAQVLARMLLPHSDHGFHSAEEVLAVIESLPLPAANNTPIPALLPAAELGEYTVATLRFDTQIMSSHLFSRLINLIDYGRELYCKHPWRVVLGLEVALAAGFGATVWFIGTLLHPVQPPLSIPQPVVTTPSTPQPPTVTLKPPLSLNAASKKTLNGTLQQNQLIAYRLVVEAENQLLNVPKLETPAVSMELRSPSGSALKGTTVSQSQTFQLQNRGVYQLWLKLKPGVVEQPYRLRVGLQPLLVSDVTLSQPPVNVSAPQPALRSVPQQPFFSSKAKRHQPLRITLKQASPTPTPSPPPVPEILPEIQISELAQEVSTPSPFTVNCGRDAAYIVEKVPPGCRVP